MDNALIVVNTDTETVSARELHEKLNIGTEFRKWFPRMTEYGFIENEDYTRVSQKCPTLGGVQEMVDYLISLDMAKQICMIQRTPEGKAVRQYLIDLEKAWNTPEQVMARALVLAQRVITDKDKKIAELTPKAEYFDALVERNLLTNFRDTAKELGVKERKFTQWLEKKGFIYRDTYYKIKPVAKYCGDESKSKYFELKEFARDNGYAGNQTLVTPAGREAFRLLFKG